MPRKLANPPVEGGSEKSVELPGNEASDCTPNGEKPLAGSKGFVDLL